MFNGDIGWMKWEGLHFSSAYFTLIGVMPLLLFALVSSERQALCRKGSGEYTTAESDTQA
jgi:hypothetical protein